MALKIVKSKEYRGDGENESNVAPLTATFLQVNRSDDALRMTFVFVRHTTEVDLAGVSLPDAVFTRTPPFAFRIPSKSHSSETLSVNVEVQPPRAFCRVPTQALSAFNLNHNKVNFRLADARTISIARYSPALWPEPLPLIDSGLSPLEFSRAADGATVGITFNVFARQPVEASLASKTPQVLSLHPSPPRGLLAAPSHAEIPSREWILTVTHDARETPDQRTLVADLPRGRDATHQHAVLHRPRGSGDGGKLSFTPLDVVLVGNRAQGSAGPLNEAFDVMHNYARMERLRETARARLGKEASEIECQRADAAAGVVAVPLPEYAPAVDGSDPQPFEAFHAAFAAPVVPLSRARLAASKRGDQTMMKVVRQIPREAAKAELERMGESVPKGGRSRSAAGSPRGRGAEKGAEGKPSAAEKKKDDRRRGGREVGDVEMAEGEARAESKGDRQGSGPRGGSRSQEGRQEGGGTDTRSRSREREGRDRSPAVERGEGHRGESSRASGGVKERATSRGVKQEVVEERRSRGRAEDADKRRESPKRSKSDRKASDADGGTSSKRRASRSPARGGDLERSSRSKGDDRTRESGDRQSRRSGDEKKFTQEGRADRERSAERSRTRESRDKDDKRGSTTHSRSRSRKE